MAARDFFTDVLDDGWCGGLQSRHDNAGSSIFARNLQKILNRRHFPAGAALRKDERSGSNRRK
jgi:hypothetical protein